jgi:hypothetical protein
MKKNVLKFMCALGLTFFQLSLGLSQTTIDAEFRPRTEFREGFRKPLADTLNPAIITFQRTRLNTDYKSKILNARISLQDSRIWGNTDNKTNTSKVEVYEAWAEYLVASGFSIQMGRQPLKYDDQRLLAAPNWSNTGTSHDAFVFKYKSPFITAHLGAAYNNTKDTLLDISYSYTAKQNYKALGYLWLSKELYAGTTLSLIGITEEFQNTKNYLITYPRYTFGGNLLYANDSSVWGATLTGYYQQGKDPGKVDGKSIANLKAYFLAAKASYKILPILSANIGVDYFSGSATDIESDKSHTFNRLYGATHTFNGYMEYFVSTPTQGLIDYYLGVTGNITPKFSVELTGHSFSFDKDFLYNKVKTEKNLGSELDLVLNYTASKEIAVQGGYSRYFNSSSTKSYFKTVDVATHTQQWAYVMFTFKPSLYKTPVVPLPESK